jgi:hypothetical protein
MNIRLSVAAAILSAAAPSALAAGFLHVYLTPRAATLEPGGTMLIDITADYSDVPSGLSIAGWKFDVLGNANGTLTGDVNDAVFSNGVNNGVSTGPNLLDYAGGQLPLNLGGGNPTTFLGTISYTASPLATDYDVTLSITDYFSPSGALNVYINASGAQSRSVPSPPPIGGGGHEVIQISTPFTVVPAPAAAAPLALMLLAARRRR